jgi:hypothetical protein
LILNPRVNGMPAFTVRPQLKLRACLSCPYLLQKQFTETPPQFPFPRTHRWLRLFPQNQLITLPVDSANPPKFNQASATADWMNASPIQGVCEMGSDTPGEPLGPLSEIVCGDHGERDPLRYNGKSCESVWRPTPRARPLFTIPYTQSSPSTTIMERSTGSWFIRRPRRTKRTRRSKTYPVEIPW